MRPILVRVTPVGRGSALLEWSPPLGVDPAQIDHYEVQISDPVGLLLSAHGSSWEVLSPTPRADPPLLGQTLHGFAWGHRYGFAIRAVRPDGTPWPAAWPVYATILTASPPAVPAGRRIELLDADRQSLEVRLGGIDCQLFIWWQPLDSSWYGSLEVPINTPAVQSRRLMTDTGLLDRLPHLLPGNLMTRSTSVDRLPPSRDAWARGSHALVWEAR